MPQPRIPAWLMTDLTVIVAGLAIISVVVWMAP
jgi:hypothetical protein